MTEPKFKIGDRCQIIPSETGCFHRDKVGTIVTVTEIQRFPFGHEPEYHTDLGHGCIMESRLISAPMAESKADMAKSVLQGWDKPECQVPRKPIIVADEATESKGDENG